MGSVRPWPGMLCGLPLVAVGSEERTWFIFVPYGCEVGAARDHGPGYRVGHDGPWETSSL